MNRHGRPVQALELLEKAFSIDTFVPPGWEFAKGHSYILMRDYDNALAHILPVTECVPQFVPARAQLARAYSEMGLLKEAGDTVLAIRETSPAYGIDKAVRMFPYPGSPERDRFISALQLTGLPQCPCELNT